MDAMKAPPQTTLRSTQLLSPGENTPVYNLPCDRMLDPPHCGAENDPMSIWTYPSAVLADGSDPIS